MLTIPQISPSEAMKKLKQRAVLVDIRQPSDYQQAHVAQAIHLHNDSFRQFTQDYVYDTPIIVLCYHGISSYKVALYLYQMGYEEVYSVQGGMTAWCQQFPDQILRKA